MARLLVVCHCPSPNTTELRDAAIAAINDDDHDSRWPGKPFVIVFIDGSDRARQWYNDDTLEIALDFAQP